MILVGHWINNRWGWGRKVVKLYRSPEIPDGTDWAWVLHVEIGRHLEGDTPYRTEARGCVRMSRSC